MEVQKNTPTIPHHETMVKETLKKHSINGPLIVYFGVKSKINNNQTP